MVWPSERIKTIYDASNPNVQVVEDAEMDSSLSRMGRR